MLAQNQDSRSSVLCAFPQEDICLVRECSEDWVLISKQEESSVGSGRRHGTTKLVHNWLLGGVIG